MSGAEVLFWLSLGCLGAFLAAINMMPRRRPLGRNQRGEKMGEEQMVTVTLPLDGLLWLRDCAEGMLDTLEPLSDEDAEKFASADEAIRMIDAQLAASRRYDSRAEGYRPTTI